MVSSREDFLMNLLNCGNLDLRLIDDVGYDIGLHVKTRKENTKK